MEWPPSMPMRTANFPWLWACDDLIGGGAELEFVGCAADLLERGVDEVEGAAGGGVGGVLAGVDPDGEELCVEVALLRGVVVEHAAVERVGEVPVLVDEALGVSAWVSMTMALAWTLAGSVICLFPVGVCAMECVEVRMRLAESTAEARVQRVSLYGVDAMK